MVRSKIWLTVSRLPLRPFLPFAILSSFSDLVLFSSSLLHRVFPWLFYHRQPGHRGPPPGAEAGWLRDFANRRPFAGGAALGDPGPHPAGSPTAPPSSACRGASLGRPLARPSGSSHPQSDCRLAGGGSRPLRSLEGLGGSLRCQAGAGVRQGLVSRPEPGLAGYLAAASRHGAGAGAAGHHSAGFSDRRLHRHQIGRASYRERV